MRYYSNAQLHRGMDNMYQMERQARKKLEYAMAALKTIAEGAETREDRVELTREEMIAAAKTALAELNTRKEWK